MFPVQCNMRLFRVTCSNIEISPPVSVGCQPWAGILVQAVVVFIPNEEDSKAREEDQDPMGQEETEHFGCEHVEFAESLLERKMTRICVWLTFYTYMVGLGPNA